MANLPATKSTTTTTSFQDKRHRSIFEVPPNFFDSCRLLPSPHSSVSEHHSVGPTLQPSSNDDVVFDAPQNDVVSAPRLTCNTCKTQFDSLQDQRSHFKSDIHRFNVKLTVAGKNIVKEEDFEVLTSEFVQDYDVSSISGSESEDDSETESQSQNVVRDKLIGSFKQKLFFRLQTGQRVSVWKCLIMNVTENVLYENTKVENEVIDKLKSLSVEPRDNTHLRIVLLASGGHFVGCVFDGDAVVAHKTFHRYVVRAKAGKKQSSKDASGRAAHSAGASLRRYNELALKKDVHELLAAWKPYFDASNCIFIHAPSSSRQLLYDGERPYFSNQQCAIRNIALSVRRPTFREAKRVYSQMTQVTYEADEKEVLQSKQEDLVSINISKTNGSPAVSSKGVMAELDDKDKAIACSSKQNDELPISSNGESEDELYGKTTPLHEAAQSGDYLKVLELLEQGLDPCIKDERGRTPYMLAHDKEVRNNFRRFMASNLDKWDWHAAKVPSALTKEMEESQAAKQAEKDAKRKARAKELKKLRKAKEKKAQVEAPLPKNDSKTADKQVTAPSIKGQSQLKSGVRLSKEDEIKMAQVAEREKRAAAAERRITALNIQANSATTATAPSMSGPKTGLAGDIYCSCCNSSLAGKVPFHRYNYKYCSTSCMHVHKEILEDQ